MPHLTIALAGNPNCGKSVTFNNLTGLHQHVANYPGVTVEQKTGKTSFGGYDITVVDLPGTYGLTAFSPDEIVARDFILKSRPDVVVNVVSATTYERSLYLSLQLLELSIPLVLVLNMNETAQKEGVKIDSRKLSELLNVPVIETEATQNQGTKQLLEEIIKLHKFPSKRDKIEYFSDSLIEKLNAILVVLPTEIEELKTYPRLWIATKLLEQDPHITRHIRNTEVLKTVEKSAAELSCSLGHKCESLIAQDRYAYISGLLQKTYRKKIDSIQITERLDRVMLHRLFGLPLFFFIMWLIFQFTFTVSAWPGRVLQLLLVSLSSFLSSFLSPAWLSSLVVDGVLSGLGGVLVFVPQIALLFMALAVVEDSGYMARAAFLMDDYMHRLGLHGKSFVPMMLGFGCNVPAIMATRTLTSRQEKILTCMIIPFMSCSARLPVYTLLISAFFTSSVSGNILFSLYIIGIASAVLLSMILRKYIFKSQASDFVLELPPYRLPTVKSVTLYTWQRLRHYLQRAGTIILAASLIVWFLTSYPSSTETDLSGSFAGMLGKLLEPLLQPLGFDWKMGIALLVGLSAKELVISSLGTLYRIGADTLPLSEALRTSSGLTPLSAYSYMLFVLLYTPCLATLAVLRQEIGNRWTWTSLAISLGWAYLVSLTVYQLGSALGF